MGDNKLSSLDVTVSKNPKLVELRCNNNQIKELNLSKNKKLSQVNCYGNKLTLLDLSDISINVKPSGYVLSEKKVRRCPPNYSIITDLPKEKII